MKKATTEFNMDLEKRAYGLTPSLPGMFSLEEVLYVFGLCFYEYEHYTGQPHPFLKRERIQLIIKRLHYCYGEKIRPMNQPLRQRSTRL